ncbi:MAG: heme exporter protein CcmB [Gammaproteobacteria bacterium]|nr:heme exporter protein CcmB [Gammaproteobacteria bacterium]
MLETLRFIFYSELIIRLRRTQSALFPLIFYLIVMLLFPLALTTDDALLQKLFPGCLWIAVLFASLIAIDHAFHSDLEESHLEQCVLGHVPFFLIVLTKLSVVWITSALPLVILTPILGLLFHVSFATTLMLMLTLLMGTPMLILIGSLGCALTLKLKQQSILLGVLILPLCIPILIFGVNITQQFIAGNAIAGPLALMGALLMTTVLFLPVAIASVIKISLDD